MKTFKQFLEELVPQSGTQYGSNEGGVHTDTETGQKHYVKYYKNSQQGKVEALTGKIYQHMGIHTLEPEVQHVNGREAISTRWNDNLHSMKPHEFDNLSPEQADDVGRMYHAAVLTKNWDIAGLEHDNIMKHSDGRLYAVDHGGAFHFRAQGGPKPYGPDVGEHDSLRYNDQASGHVFTSAFNQHPQAERNGLEAVKNMNDDHIEHLFKTSGLDNWRDLHYNFMQRKQALLNKYK